MKNILKIAAIFPVTILFTLVLAAASRYVINFCNWYERALKKAVNLGRQ